MQIQGKTETQERSLKARLSGTYLEKSYINYYHFY